jgi:hypothetical protein
MNIRIQSTILHSVTLSCILMPSFRVHFDRQIGLFSWSFRTNVSSTFSVFPTRSMFPHSYPSSYCYGVNSRADAEGLIHFRLKRVERAFIWLRCIVFADVPPLYPIITLTFQSFIRKTAAYTFCTSKDSYKLIIFLCLEFSTKTWML